MGAYSSIHKSLDQGKIDLKLDWLHPLGRGLSSADCLVQGASNRPLSALVGSLSFTQQNIFQGGERLDILLEKGVNDSNNLVKFRWPLSPGDSQHQCITLRNTRTPATSIHGIATNSFGSLHGGVRVRTVAVEMDQKWVSNPKLISATGIRIEQAGTIGDDGRPILIDSYECPITFSGRAYDKLLVAKLAKEYTDSNDDNFTQYNILMELGLPVLPRWLHFKRLKVQRRQGVKLGPAFGMSSIHGGFVIGDLAPHSAFPIGGFNSVRGYGEGAVGTGRSYFVATNELSFPLIGSLQGAMFADFGTDMGSGRTVPGDPAGARRRPGSGFGYGAGIRIDSSLGPFRIDYAMNESYGRCVHFGFGYHE